MPNLAVKYTAKGYGINQAVRRVFHDVLSRNAIQESLPVFLQNQLRIKSKGIRESPDLYRHMSRHEVLHFRINPIQLKLLGLHIPDEP